MDFSNIVPAWRRVANGNKPCFFHYLYSILTHKKDFLIKPNDLNKIPCNPKTC